MGLTAPTLRGVRQRASPNEAVPMPPIKLTDAELEAVMSTARPLQVELREPFLAAVARELAGHEVVGPGVVFQICRELQRVFMNGAWPDLTRAKDPVSQLGRFFVRGLASEEKAEDEGE
jgi:hypothetical protein